MRSRGETNQTVPGRLREVADRRGDDLFVVTPTTDGRGATQATTYAEMNEAVDRFAAFLAKLGVRRGDVIHLQLGNRVEFLTAFLGTIRIGAVAVPTSPGATLDDVAYVTSHAGCTVSIVEHDCAETVMEATELSPEIRQVISLGATTPGTIDFEEFRTCNDSITEMARVVRDSDPAGVFYTSGTTSWPKGVTLTHRNLLFVGEVVSSYVRATPDDRWIVALPLFHFNALGYSTMSALNSGASMTLLAGFEPETWLAAARSTSSTLASLFSVHVRQLLAKEPTPSDRVGSLRLLLYAQQLSFDERRRVRECIGPDPLQIYGMTETVAPVIGDPPYGEIRDGTMGRTLAWSAARVVDQSGREVDDDVAGELVVRGEPGITLMLGYNGRPDETSSVMSDGWLHTGDRVVRHADGTFRFLGRSSEVIKPGVNNVSALEIERVLAEHVSIAEAAVVGALDRIGNEEVVAFVELRDGEDVTPDELLMWASERLSDYKLPRRLRIVDGLPRNSVGKVLKRELQLLAARPTVGDQ